MRGVWILIAVVAAALPAVAAGDAYEKARRETLAWFAAQACKEKLMPGTPGASPDRPLEVEYFEDVYDAAVEAKEVEKGKPAKPSQFECKWVRLTGFFTWVHYWHYRGQFHASAPRAYNSPKERYWIELFRDPKLRRANLVQRKLTIVARAYDKCAVLDAIDANERKRGVVSVRFGGPCHYGDNNGMMLIDAIVEKVHDARPLYVVGEINRAFFDNLYHDEGAERATLIDRTRTWAAAVKRGPGAYVSETLAGDPALAKLTDADKKVFRADIEDPDGYIAYLHGESRFARLDPAQAETAVFRERNDDAKTAWGCICLEPECKDRWPLLAGDARRFIGDAACTELTKEEDGKWHHAPNP